MDRIIENDLERIVADRNVNWTAFKSSTVLVTGANGMIPSYLVWTLLYLNRTRGYDIHIVALVRNEMKARTKFADCCEDSSLELWVQDVSSPIRYPSQVDYVIHAASQASPRYYWTDPVGTIDANVLGTSNTLRLAFEKKSKSYMFFSSGEVYGIVDSQKAAVSENDYGYLDILNVRNCYAESKRLGENLCVAWNHQYGVPAKVGRFFHVYGPGVRMDDGRVFGDFPKNIVNNENITLHSDGSAVRFFCYMSDAVRAVFKILLDGENAHAYNIANEQGGMSIRELAGMLVSMYPEKGLRVEMQVKENDPATKMKSAIELTLPDCTSLQNLGWRADVGVKEGFARTIDFLERNLHCM